MDWLCCAQRAAFQHAGVGRVDQHALAHGVLLRAICEVRSEACPVGLLVALFLGLQLQLCLAMCGFGRSVLMHRLGCRSQNNHELLRSTGPLAHCCAEEASA